MNQPNTSQSEKYTFSDAIKWEKQNKQRNVRGQYNIWLIIAILSLFIVVAYIIAYYAFSNAELCKKTKKIDKDEKYDTDSDSDED